METRNTTQEETQEDTSFVELAEGNLGKAPVAPPENEQQREARFAAPVAKESKPEDIARTQEIIKEITSAVEKIPVTPEKAQIETFSEEDREKSRQILAQREKGAENFLGENIKGMSSKDLKVAIGIQESRREDTIKAGLGLSVGVGAIGVMGGLMAPAVIGLTPSLAAALPAFMTSVISVGGVGIASSALVLSGVGVGIAVAGYGIYKFRNFLNKRNAEKARKVADDKELDELF